MWSSSRVRGRGAAARGFSLIELMVVVVIIGVVAALAVPSMIQAQLDRVAYDDAGAVMQLLRSARTRSVARGGAMLVSMTSSSSDRGTFLSYEALQANPQPNPDGSSNYQTPIGSCKVPTGWTLDGAAHSSNGISQLDQLIDGVNLNGNAEVDANVQTTIEYYNGSTTSTIGPPIYVCFTPLGHIYAVYPGSATTTPAFDGTLPMVNPIEIDVERMNGSTVLGTIRSVLLPPNGMARIFSHT